MMGSEYLLDNDLYSDSAVMPQSRVVCAVMSSTETPPLTTATAMAAVGVRFATIGCITEELHTS